MKGHFPRQQVDRCSRVNPTLGDYLRRHGESIMLPPLIWRNLSAREFDSQVALGSCLTSKSYMDEGGQILTRWSKSDTSLASLKVTTDQWCTRQPLLTERMQQKVTNPNVVIY